MATALLSLAPLGAARAEDAPVSRITVFGKDECPKAAPGEIVVCAREPESERYRIPKRFRDQPKIEYGSRAWGDRVATLEDAARPMRPNSCSAVGSGGQTGCLAAMMRQWFAERQAMKAVARAVP